MGRVQVKHKWHKLINVKKLGDEYMRAHHTILLILYTYDFFHNESVQRLCIKQVSLPTSMKRTVCFQD